MAAKRLALFAPFAGGHLFTLGGHFALLRFALALQILAMGAFKGLNVDKPALGVTHGIKLFAGNTAVSRSSLLGCHMPLQLYEMNEL